MAHDVYISYSNEDKAATDAICAGLEAAGLICWIAPRDLGPGSIYSTSIAAAIAACGVVVEVVSESSLVSEKRRSELDEALYDGKVVIPFHVEATAGVQAFAIQQVVTTVRTLLGTQAQAGITSTARTLVPASSPLSPFNLAGAREPKAWPSSDRLLLALARQTSISPPAPAFDGQGTQPERGQDELIQGASFWRRGPAALIDAIVVFIGAMLGLGALLSTFEDSSDSVPEPLNSVLLAAFFAVPFIYVTGTTMLGASLGMLALNLRVVAVPGGRSGLKAALTRGAIVYALSLLSLLSMLLDPDRVTWHDRASQLRVVRRRPKTLTWAWEKMGPRREYES
jgi:uncharacterized RDD family membrane protein YckC